jgi:hypothetical protein
MSMSSCGQKKGLFGYCKRESLHPGDHDNGKTTWPRTGSDLRIYQLALAEVERLRAEQLRLEEIAKRHEQKESAVANGVCVHTPGSRTEFGEIRVKGDPPYRYREFWNVTACTKCGEETHREADEYYGDDMADIHWKWRR